MEYNYGKGGSLSLSLSSRWGKEIAKRNTEKQ